MFAAASAQKVDPSVDRNLEKMQKKTRLDRTDEVALVLSVKQKFEVDFAQKALLKKVASHLKQTVASNYQTRNILEE